MRYAAYDNIAIYGVGFTVLGTLKAARVSSGVSDTWALKVDPIEDSFAQSIEDNGF